MDTIDSTECIPSHPIVSLSSSSTEGMPISDTTSLSSSSFSSSSSSSAVSLQPPSPTIVTVHDNPIISTPTRNPYTTTTDVSNETPHNDGNPVHSFAGLSPSKRLSRPNPKYEENTTGGSTTTTSSSSSTKTKTKTKNDSENNDNQHQQHQDNNNGDEEKEKEVPIKKDGRGGRTSNDTTDWHCTICMQFHPDFQARVNGLKKRTNDEGTKEEQGIMDTHACSSSSSSSSSLTEETTVTSAVSELDTLISCEGGCLRSYHAVCLGLTLSQFRTLQTSSEPWLCNDCRNHYDHACAICHMKGDRPYIPYRIWGDIHYLLTCNAPDILPDIRSLLEDRVLKTVPLHPPSSISSTSFFSSSSSKIDDTDTTITTGKPTKISASTTTVASKKKSVGTPTTTTTTTLTTTTTVLPPPSSLHSSSSTVSTVSTPSVAAVPTDTLSITVSTATTPLSTTQPTPRKRGRQPGFSPKPKTDESTTDTKKDNDNNHSGVATPPTSGTATNNKPKRSVSLPVPPPSSVTKTLSIFGGSSSSSYTLTSIHGNPMIAITQPLSSVELVKQALLDQRIIMGDTDDLDNQHRKEGDNLNTMEVHTEHTTPPEMITKEEIVTNKDDTGTVAIVSSSSSSSVPISAEGTTEILPTKRRRNTLGTVTVSLPLDKVKVPSVTLPDTTPTTITAGSTPSSSSLPPALPENDEPSPALIKALHARTIGKKSSSSSSATTNRAKKEGLIYGTMCDEPLPSPYIPPLIAGSPSYLVGTPWKKVRKCSVRQCGKFYHYSCLRYLSDIAVADYYIRTAKLHRLPIPLFVPVTTPPVDIEYLQNLVTTRNGNYTVTVENPTSIPSATPGGGNKPHKKGKSTKEKVSSTVLSASATTPIASTSAVSTPTAKPITTPNPNILPSGAPKRGRPFGAKTKTKTPNDTTGTPATVSSTATVVSETTVPPTVAANESDDVMMVTDNPSIVSNTTATVENGGLTVPIRMDSTATTMTTLSSSSTSSSSSVTLPEAPLRSDDDTTIPVPHILPSSETTDSIMKEDNPGTNHVPPDIELSVSVSSHPAKRKRMSKSTEKKEENSSSLRSASKPSTVVIGKPKPLPSLSIATPQRNESTVSVHDSTNATALMATNHDNGTDSDTDDDGTEIDTDVSDTYESDAAFFLTHPPALPPIPMGFKPLDPSHESLTLIEPIWLAPGLHHHFICPRHICDSCEVGLGSVHSIVTSPKYQYSCALERIRRNLPIGKGLYLSIRNPKEYNLSNSLFLFNPLMRETLRKALTTPDEIFRDVPRWNPYLEQLAVVQGLYGLANGAVSVSSASVPSYAENVRHYNRYTVTIPQPPWWTVAHLVQASLKGKYSSTTSSKTWVYIDTATTNDDNDEGMDTTLNALTPTTSSVVTSLPPAYQPKITLLSVFPSVPYRLSKAEVLQHWMYRTGQNFANAFTITPSSSSSNTHATHDNPGGPVSLDSIRTYPTLSPLDYVAYDILADTTPSFVPRKLPSASTTTAIPTDASSSASSSSSSLVLSPSRSKIKPDHTLLPFNLTPARDWMVVTNDRLPYAKKFLTKKFRAACMRCVRMYHEKDECMPPGCAFNLYTFLCPIHSCYPLPGETVDDVMAATGISAADSHLLLQSDTSALQPQRSFVNETGTKDNNPTNTFTDNNENDEDNDPLLHHSSFDHLSPQVLQLTTSTLVQKLRNLFIPPYHDLSVRETTDRRHYRIPVMYPPEVEEFLRKNEKPPPFTYIRKNIYVTKIRPEYLESEVCNCVTIARANGIPLDGTYTGKICDEYCINRQLRVECYGGDKSILQKLQASKNKNSSSKGDKENDEDEGTGTGTTTTMATKGSALSSYQRKTNCSIGGHCGNRAIQLRNSPNVKVIATPGKGWGLLADERIEAGTFIIEYVGEIIDEGMQSQRLDEAKARGEYHAYMMQIDTNQIIDARFKANNARFINHSCDPNSELQRWQVEGYTRIGIFALRDIPKGEEITYDYQFFTMEETKCYCGTGKCRGYLGANVAQDKAREADRLRQEKLDEKRRKRAETMEKKKLAAAAVAAVNAMNEETGKSTTTNGVMLSSSSSSDIVVNTTTSDDTEDEEEDRSVSIDRTMRMTVDNNDSKNENEMDSIFH